MSSCSGPNGEVERRAEAVSPRRSLESCSRDLCRALEASKPGTYPWHRALAAQVQVVDALAWLERTEREGKSDAP